MNANDLNEVVQSQEQHYNPDDRVTDMRWLIVAFKLTAAIVGALENIRDEIRER